MRSRIARAVAIVVALSACVGVRMVFAADPEVSVSLMPLRSVLVRGDNSKFRAHHWMTSDGYAGGVKDFSMKYAFPDGTELAADSHAIINDNDLGADFSLKKEKLGFFDLGYSEFRRYYGAVGGVYYPFNVLSGIATQKQLELDLGKLDLEGGLTLEGWPEIGFQYEREFKDGAKSRLSWTSTKVGSTTRYIGPAWQDVDEIADTFVLKTAHEVGGFALNGEQRWERVRTETLREEKFLATTGVASNSEIRRQDQAPEANLMTTLLGGERSFLNDKAFFASAYRFAHLENREYESLAEFDENGVLRSFGHSKYNARADTDFDTHTWVGNLTLTPWNWLNVGTKLKAEVLKRHSNSSYPSDTTNPPDFIPNTTEASITENKTVRWGEGLSLRVTRIPRTALYTELELEQGRVLMREDRKSIAGQSASSAGDIFNRETVTGVRRGTWTLGGQVAPASSLNLTAHVRRRVNNNDYDDQRESDAGSTTALSAFIDEQNVHTDEFAMRATLRPCRWFRSSVRYQFRDDKYSTRAEAQDTVKAGMRSHIYTYDVTLQPLHELTTTASFSRQTALTTTPARLASSANIPAFHADVNTWLFNADYTPQARVTLNGALQVSRAKNFNDYTSTGMPYGADFTRVDFSTGLTWTVTDDTSVGTEYAYYSYLPNALAELGGYHANVLWIEVSKKF